MSSPIVAVLLRASRGQATFAELATALEAHDAPWAILTGPSMAQIQAASKIPGTRAPRGTIDGVTTADGRFAARLFTDGDLATAYGQGHGLADADGGVPLVTVPGAGGFVDCLVNGWDGLIIDDGTEHTLSLERPSVTTLYALLTLDALGRQPQLHAALSQGRPHIQSGAQGRIAFVYETADDVVAGARLQPAEVTIAPRPTGQIVRTSRP